MSQAINNSNSTSQSEYEKQIFFNTKFRVKIYQNKKGKILIKPIQTNQKNKNENNNNNDQETLHAQSTSLKSPIQTSSKIIRHSITKSSGSSIKCNLKQLNSNESQIESLKDRLVLKNKNLPFDINIAFADLMSKDNLLN